MNQEQKEDLYVSWQEAEEHMAIIGILVGIMAVIAILLAVWLGFYSAKFYRTEPAPQPHRLELTSSELHALAIAKAKAESKL